MGCEIHRELTLYLHCVPFIAAFRLAQWAMVFQVGYSDRVGPAARAFGYVISSYLYPKIAITPTKTVSNVDRQHPTMNGVARKLSGRPHKTSSLPVATIA